MKNVKLKFAAIAFAILSLTSCSKDDDSSSTPSLPFYIAGSEDNSSGVAIAKYWNTDGTEHILSDGTNNVYVTNYFLNGNDIHTVGYSNGAAKYWKNGSEININVGTTNFSVFHDAFVNNNDVYIAGYQDVNSIATAKYWKNGSEVVLGNTTTYSWLYSVYVVGDDVYAIGSEAYYPAYWKNGVKTVYGTSNDEAFSIVVDDNDVYTSGNSYNSTTSTNYATYWKNGTEMTLNDANNFSSRAYDIKVKDGNVYVAGYIGSEAVYWKNGVRYDLPRNTGTSSAYACKIYFVNNDMYITGQENSTTGSAVKYWKNGTAHDVTDGSTYAYVANVYN